MSMRSKRAETKDEREDGERSILPARDHQISSTLLSPLDINEETKSFYGEKGQEGYRSIKAAVFLAVQVMKSAIKLNSHSHVCFFSLCNRCLGSNQPFCCINPHCHVCLFFICNRHLGSNQPFYSIS